MGCGCVFTRNFTSDVKLDGKTVVITGGNIGLGKETAKDLYKRGARIIICSRNQDRSKLAIEEIKLEIKQLNDFHDIKAKSLDLADLSSVRKCAEKILAEENEINYLINNAGVMGHPQQLSADGFEMHFAANYLGHFLFTLLLLPKIIRSGPARIINVSSCSHKIFWLSRRLDLSKVRKGRRWLFQIKPYCQSKCAQVIFSKELAKRLKDAGVNNVTTYSLHPGAVRTNMYNTWDEFLPGLVRACTFVTSILKPPKEGIKTILYCTLDKELQNQSGLYYSDCTEVTPNNLVNDINLAKELWEISLKFTSLENCNPFTSEKKL